MAAPQDFVANRLLLSGQVSYVVITGTTNASANTSSTFAHGLDDDKGRALVPIFVLPKNNTGANTCYEGAAATSTLVDIRSTATAVPFTCIVFAVAN